MKFQPMLHVTARVVECCKYVAQQFRVVAPGGDSTVVAQRNITRIKDHRFNKLNTTICIIYHSEQLVGSAFAHLQIWQRHSQKIDFRPSA